MTHKVATVALAALATMLLAVSHGHAGLLSCTFTEPFFTIQYDSETRDVRRLSPDDTGPHAHEFKTEIVARDATIVADKDWGEAPTARLMSGSEILMRLTFSGRGTDGMSDRLYPIEGVWGAEPRGNNVGGCSTDKAPGFDLYELYDELGLQP